MKIVFATDFHLDAMPGGYDLHQDACNALSTVEVECMNAGLLVLGGDIFHNRRPTPRAYETVLALLQTVPCPVILVQGNHDIGTYGPLATVRMTGVKESIFEADGMEFTSEQKVVVVEQPMVVGVDGRKFLIAPYVPQSRVQVALHDLYLEAFEHGRVEQVLAAFCHMSVHGAKVLGIEMPLSADAIPMDKAERLGCPVLNGHVHVPQMVGCVTMPGSLVPVSFGERGERSIAVLEV